MVNGDSEKTAGTWHFKLYIAGQAPRSISAFLNLKKFCETHMNEKYELEVVDLDKSPDLAQEHNIFAVPTLLKLKPAPIKKIVGDLTDPVQLLQILE
jgi:circadian clock protein KaiB